MPANFTVNQTTFDNITVFQTINAAIAAASGDAIITVNSGTYNENVVINKAGITLLSSGGPGVTTINGSGTGGALGTIVVTPGVNNVTIGQTGQGFTINGFDGPNPGIETAAVYLQGAHDDIEVEG
ncbi:MAG: hypothetical protein ACRC14_03585, partial [Paracoccaceae bacterium]